YVRPEDAAAEHERLLAWEEEMLALVDLPYRVIDTAAGDLGTSAARKFDCDDWLPTQERYLELTSTSNCTTFQARRLAIRERTESGNRPVATLNGTLATTRWIVAILENHQLADGSVRVPEGLRGYLGGLETLEPVSPCASDSSRSRSPPSPPVPAPWSPWTSTARSCTTTAPSPRRSAPRCRRWPPPVRTWSSPPDGPRTPACRCSPSSA